MAAKRQPKQPSATKKKSSSGRAENGKVDASGKELPIKHLFGQNIQPLFGNAFVVRHEKGMFHLLFFHTRGPLILTDDPEEQKKLLEEVEFVPADCLAHIVVTPSLAKEVIDVLSVNFSKFKAKLPEDLRAKFETSIPEE